MADYSRLGADDFEEAIAGKLLPRGLAWTRSTTSVLRGFWRGIAQALARLHGRAADLTEREAWPPLSVELLPDWERVFGLPDPCLGPNPVTTARQAAVAARLVGNGGQSIAYYKDVAQSLGGAISVTEYAPFRLGVDRFTKPLYTATWQVNRFRFGLAHFGEPFWKAGTDLGWAHAWLVTLTTGALFRFKFDVSRFGEPFWQVAGGPIQCEIQRLAPAHTRVHFAIAPGVPADQFFMADVSTTEGTAGVL